MLGQSLATTLNFELTSVFIRGDTATLPPAEQEQPRRRQRHHSAAFAATSACDAQGICQLGSPVWAHELLVSFSHASTACVHQSPQLHAEILLGLTP